MKNTVTFDLDAFERRMEGTRAIEPGDVELLIEVLRSERAARAAVEQERDRASGLVQRGGNNPMVCHPERGRSRSEGSLQNQGFQEMFRCGST
jgi:hypothetical protein